MDFTELKPIEVDINLFTGPLVYHFFKDGVSYYIGSSQSLGRAILPNHKQARRCIATNCKLEIIPCKTRDEAYTLENYLIVKHQPVLNKMKGKSFNPIKGKRPNLRVYKRLA